MEEGYNNWSALLRKYLRNEITPAEKEEIDRQIKASPMKQQQFEEQTGPDAFINDLKQVYYFDRKKVQERLEAKLPFLQLPPVIPLYKRIAVIGWVGIAAAVIAIIYVSIWLLIPVSKNSNLPVKSYSYVKLPDGTEVNLEKISNVMPYEVAAFIIRNTDDGIVVELKEQASKKTGGENYAVVTAAEKEVSVWLPDGTAVQLNAQSTFRTSTPFNRASRNVALTGEAFFTVATNKKVPFVVSLDEIEVIAEGTVFNIRNYENQEVATTLLNGKITMKRGSDSILLKQGEQVQTVNKRKFKTVKNPDIDQAVAWRKEDFYFKNMPIKEVMIEIGHWYGCEVKFYGPEIENVRASGKFERNLNIDKLIIALEKTNPIKINKVGNKLVISPK
ncbi:FecR family protein [Niastella yeongjuensis]|nr:FecR domain-containing protein [Niastella yeongjuensis]SEP32936.1 FecR family protein [Niastella yeongjuensis]